MRRCGCCGSPPFVTSRGRDNDAGKGGFRELSHQAFPSDVTNAISGPCKQMSSKHPRQARPESIHLPQLASPIKVQRLLPTSNPIFLSPSSQHQPQQQSSCNTSTKHTLQHQLSHPYRATSKSTSYLAPVQCTTSITDRYTLRPIVSEPQWGSYSHATTSSASTPLLRPST